MYPYIEIFGRQLTSYGVMAGLGCLIVFVISLVRVRKLRSSLDDQLFFIGFILVGAIVGAKVLYQLQHISELWRYGSVIFSSLNTFLEYFGQGMVFYGGLIGGCLGAIAYAKCFNVNAVPNAEAIIPCIPLFHCFGRIGCFLGGCCYGIEYDGPFSVTFTQAIGGPNGVPLLPIQLIEAGANLITFFVLMALLKRFKRPLQDFGLYLAIYSVERLIFEFFRGDIVRGSFLSLSTSQWLSLIILPIGLYFLLAKDNIIVRLCLNSKKTATIYKGPEKYAAEHQNSAES